VHLLSYAAPWRGSPDRQTGRRVDEKVDFLFAFDVLEVCICTSTNPGRSFTEYGEMNRLEREEEIICMHACVIALQSTASVQMCMNVGFLDGPVGWCRRGRARAVRG